MPAVGSTQLRIDQSAIGGGGPGVLSIGTSEEAITLTDIATPGYCWVKNLDTTNYVDYGPSNGGSMVVFGKLLAGEEALFRVGGSVTIKMRANTAACKVEIRCLET